MKREILEQLQADRAEKRPVVLATFLKTGEQRLLYLVGKKGLKDLDPRIGEAARAALLEDKPRTIETEQGALQGGRHLPLAPSTLTPVPTTQAS